MIFTYALQEFAATHTVLIDMVYPYVTRMAQDVLAQWSSSVDYCLWQTVAVLLGLAVLASVVLMIVLRWNPIQWLGWVLAAGSMLFFLHTAIYGLNSYAGSLAEDIRLEEVEYTVSELSDAATYYRDKANELAPQVNRDAAGDVEYPEFSQLALQAEDGFQSLIFDYSYPVFSGCMLPVKELGWADMYSSMGITGFTMALTGEAAVNPQIPDVALPFTMCHEMSHRLSISLEKDANFAAFLACQANSSIDYQYSAYFMAYRYCYNTLLGIGSDTSTAAAQKVSAGVSSQLQHDLTTYNEFFSSHKDESATKVANTVNDTYIKANGDESGVTSYGNVTDLLVSWHIQEVILPSQVVEEQLFDPFDPTQVDISDIIGAEG